MRSPLGQTVRQWAGVFAVLGNRDEAEEVASTLRQKFRVYRIYVVDLAGGDRLKAIDLDPDLADMREGFAVVIEAEGT
mgnify:FL=1